MFLSFKRVPYSYFLNRSIILRTNVSIVCVEINGVFVDWLDGGLIACPMRYALSRLFVYLKTIETEEYVLRLRRRSRHTILRWQTIERSDAHPIEGRPYGTWLTSETWKPWDSKATARPDLRSIRQNGDHKSEISPGLVSLVSRLMSQ